MHVAMERVARARGVRRMPRIDMVLLLSLLLLLADLTAPPRTDVVMADVDVGTSSSCDVPSCKSFLTGDVLFLQLPPLDPPPRPIRAI